MSVWEFRAAVRYAKQQGAEKLDEDKIFAGYERMRSLELAAMESTQRMTKGTRRMLRGVPVDELAVHFQDDSPLKVVPSTELTEPAEPERQLVAPFSVSNLQPFNDSGLYAL